jgi:hypothetical protein
MATPAIVTIEFPEQGVELRMHCPDLRLSTARDAIDVTPEGATARQWNLGEVVHFAASADVPEELFEGWKPTKGGEL